MKSGAPLAGAASEASDGLAGKARRLLVDVSIICREDQGTGIQRVVRSIWRRLRDAVDPDIPVVPVAADRHCEYSILSEDFIDKKVTDLRDLERIEPSAGDVFLGLDLAVRTLPKYEKQFRVWKSRGLRVYLLVYDLLPLSERQWFRWRARHNFRRWLGFLARQADGAICISGQVAGELRAWLDRHTAGEGPATRVSFIGLGHDIEESRPSQGLPPDAESIIAQMRERPTLIMVGTVEPRKGHALALEAFQRIWKGRENPAVNLFVIGRSGWKTGRLQREMRRLQETEPRFGWLDEVSDQFLVALYKESTGLLSCSYAEGYGLPVMEALYHGVPVLARALPVYHEVAGDRISYFDRDDPQSLANEIVTFLDRIPNSATRGKGSASASWVEATDALLRDIECNSSLGIRALAAASLGDDVS